MNQCVMIRPFWSALRLPLAGPPGMADFERVFRTRACQPEFEQAQTNQRQMFATPEQLAVQHERRHSEHACLLRLGTNVVVQLAAFSVSPGRETGSIGTCRVEHTLDNAAILNVERALPEALVDNIVIGGC